MFLKYEQNLETILLRAHSHDLRKLKRPSQRAERGREVGSLARGQAGLLHQVVLGRETSQASCH